jgi:hypothetical protein
MKHNIGTAYHKPENPSKMRIFKICAFSGEIQLIEGAGFLLFQQGGFPA